MRRAFFQGPFLHGMGNNIGRFVIKGFILVDRIHQFFIDILGKLFFDDIVIKGILAKILRHGNKFFFFDNILPFSRKRRGCLFHR
jgi:DNA helicase HerA-like ATPase